MDRGARLGANAGGLAWMLVLGIAIDNWILIVAPILLALVGIRWIRKPGPIVLWVIGWNLLVMNVYYDDIPETFLGISTGKEWMSLLIVNVVLGAGVVVGLWLTARAES